MSVLEPDVDRRLMKRVKDRIGRVALGAGLIAAATTFVARIGTAQSNALLHGNHPTEASSLTSHAAAGLPLTVHVSFALRNRAALNKLLSELQNPASPNYHKWLTPAEFDVRFGRATSEVQAVSQWLTSQGFHLTHSSARNLTAAATVSQAESAFATTIAASSDGATYGNLSDPQIPAQFAAVIGSIDGLDNTLHSQPLTVKPPNAHPAPARMTPHSAANAPLKPAMVTRPASSEPAAVAPDFSSGGGIAFGPSDLYTFYNETPLLNAGTNGSSGDCVAVAEDSDFNSNSVTLFDSNFSLTPANITRVFPDGASPGINSDEVEVLLDIEWAHAVAPGAPINVYIGTSLTDAITRPVIDNQCGAISISYAFCGGSPSFLYQHA
jgi:subtilase family serine protease